jgi:hypothetical protein
MIPILFPLLEEDSSFFLSLKSIWVIKKPLNTKNIVTPMGPRLNGVIKPTGQWYKITKITANALTVSNCFM